MQCPKCKIEIDNKTLKCPECGTRVASICKNCGHINSIKEFNCAECGKQLLKKCPSCGAINTAEAKICRKCNENFVKPINNTPNISVNKTSQQKVKQGLIDAIKDSETSIITLSGESGCGKNLILRYAINELKNANLIWLLGTCTQVTQLSPFGYFQDLLLSFFNVNNFCHDTLQLKKNSIKFFKQDFPMLSNGEIIDLLNFLYPENLDKFENIYINKTKTFNILRKVILTVVEKTKVVFIIDKFSNIDGMSFDFLKELLEIDIILERCKFIIITTQEKPGMGLIASSKLDLCNYKDLSIAPFSRAQVATLTSQYINLNVNDDFINTATTISSGNPAIVEQMIMLQKDIKRLGLKFGNYNNFDDIITRRLNILKQEDVNSYKLLMAMAILGEKCYPAILEHFNNNSQQEFERIIEVLIQRGYINQVNNLTFEFKSNQIWKSFLSIFQNDEMYKEVLSILYDTISIYKQSSITTLAYISMQLSNQNQAFEIWTILMKQCSYVGDIGLYIISQKQALKLIEEKSDLLSMKIKKNIYTRVGKLLEPINHEEAFKFIQNSIMLLNENEVYEYIELLGYLASCAMKSGNYWGVIECVDNVLDKIPENMELERTLVKARKIKPLLHLGNYGQLVNLIDTEIMPIIEKYLSKGKNTDILPIEDIYENWIEIYFNLAEALTFQGDIRMFDTIKQIFDIIEKNKIITPTIICKANLALALANTIKGDIKVSERILDDILKEQTLDNMDSFIISRWNLIDILNNFASKNYDNIHSELFNVVAYANNINDNFTKNICKTLLAKIFKDSNNIKKALEILEEQVSYFAKEKVATGVLLSWYLIAEIKLITNGAQFALDIVTKALDIAQSPNINNYYFITLFNKLIGEIYMAKQDFDSAKVYIEKSIFLAKQFDLQEILVKNYILYAKFYQELALPKTKQRPEYVKSALKMFQFAKAVPIVERHVHLQKRIREELAILSNFCKLNGIILKKNIR